jgi:hypothetical protein
MSHGYRELEQPLAIIKFEVIDYIDQQKCCSRCVRNESMKIFTSNRHKCSTSIRGQRFFVRLPFDAGGPQGLF